MGYKFSFRGLSDELHKRYVSCFDYLMDSRKFIYLAIGIFFLFALIGFFVPFPESIQNEIINYFKGLVLETEGYSGLHMILFLFSNNSAATFIGLFSGMLLGIIPFVNAVVNGFVLGFASFLSASQNGALSLLRLFPHGVFELPAVFISLGLGLRLGSFLFFKNPKEKFKQFFINSINVYFFIVLPLLVVAAIIEGLLIVL